MSTAAVTAAHHLAVHLPWWLYAVGVAVLALRLLDSHLRARMKERHRAYLTSPSWNRRRREALERAGHRCVDCGSGERLHVHHLTYKRHGSEPMRDLRVLCARCHRRRHQSGGRMDDRLDRLINWIRE